MDFFLKKRYSILVKEVMEKYIRVQLGSLYSPMTPKNPYWQQKHLNVFFKKLLLLFWPPHTISPTSAREGASHPHTHPPQGLGEAYIDLLPSGDWQPEVGPGGGESGGTNKQRPGYEPRPWKRDTVAHPLYVPCATMPKALPFDEDRMVGRIRWLINWEEVEGFCWHPAWETRVDCALNEGIRHSGDVI